MTAALRVHAWRGEAAITLASGNFTATFLPECGMLGVSLTHDGDELIALPRSIADYRRGMPRGGYTGLALNAPYANRLASHRFRVDGREVHVPRSAAADRNGLPIHGVLEAQPFAVESLVVDGQVARLVASFRYDDPALLEAFPFEHRYEVAVALSAKGLSVATTVSSLQRGTVPVSFGWHPFLRVPTTPRSQWQLRLPARRHVRLDSQLLPTDRWASEPAEHRKLGRRRFDDHFALGRDRRFSLTGNNRRVEVRFDRGYPSAQIYLPPAGMSGWLNTDFICIEPMTAPINALVHGVAPVATPSNSYAATFTISASRQSPERH